MISEKKIYAIESTAIILLWILVVLSPLLFMNNYGVDRRAIHIMWAECAVVGFAFLVNRFYLMPRLFFDKRYITYSLALIILFISLGVFVIYFDGVNLILSLFGEGKPLSHAPHRDLPPTHALRPVRHIPKPYMTTLISPMIKVFIVSVITIALDLGLRIAVTWIITEHKHSETDREKAISQLQSLQSQVSPHFFMNTLNNIHALVELDPRRAKQTIIELSSLMSYLLYDSSHKSKVSLKREIEFLRSYINLMRLRFSQQVKIDFVCDAPIEVDIPPHLFLNFIENAFKYGVDYERESFIKVEFKFSDSTIKMSVMNSNHSKTSKSKQNGLGISNSCKRLDLLYGSNYTLNIDESEWIFCVNLTIPIV